MGPCTTSNEFDMTLNSLKSGKVPGFDSISCELLILMNKQNKDKLFLLVKGNYDSLIEGFMRAIMVLLQKEIRTTVCEEYHELSILNHASKILLKLIYERLYTKTDANLAFDLFGFCNRGMREGILRLQVIAEKMIS